MPRKNHEDAVTEFGQSLGRLLRKLRAASAAHELSWTEASVLARLAKDGPATTADLARAEGVKPQSLGTTVATLEEMGFVERKPHPTDGRQVPIALTTKGAAVRQSVRDAKWKWLRESIARLNDQDRATLFAAGEIIKRLVES